MLRSPIDSSGIRSRWAALGAAVAVTLGAGGIGITHATTTSGERPIYLPIEPCRLADTRPAPDTVGPRTSPIGPDETYTISGWGAVGNCNLPSDTAGLSLNVTAVGATQQTNLRFFPAGVAVPTAANLNPTPGAPPTPNAVNVDLNASGEFSVFNRFGSVAVVIDVVGIYDDHHHDDRYYTESEVDALVASVAGGSIAYQNVVVVAKQGGDFSSVTAAMNAIGTDPDYPAASASNRYLVWVAPGIYENEDVDMQSFVDIEGSGQGVTVLRSVGGAGGITPAAATLVGADDAELREITVEIEASGPSVWAYGIYTAGNTRFHRVTATGTGGSRARGMVIDNGGAPVLIDVILRASDATVSNLGLDLVLATAFADGLFAQASGGEVANGIFVNNASSEVLMENVTAQASDAVVEVSGLKTNQSSVTVEGLRSIATGSTTSSATAVWCDDENRTMRVVGAPTIFAENSGSGAARGVFGFDCHLELRDAVVDAVSTAGGARAIQHVQNDGGQQADVTISDVEARASSATSNAIAVNLAGSGIGTFGRVSDTNLRATGGSASLSTAGISHSAAGEVQYRGLSLIVEGSALFMYGIQAAGNGVPRFDDVVVDAVGDAAATVFGVELLTDSSPLTNARVRAINTASGDFHDAVGVKANNATGVSFTDVTAYAEAETNVWGVDITNADARLTRVDARGVGAPGNWVYGARCGNGSAEVLDSQFRAVTAATVRFGFNSADCDATVDGSEAIGDAGTGSSYGFYASASGINTTTNVVRNSLLSGATGSVRTLGSGTAQVFVVNSALDGGAGTSGSPTDVQECTAVTYNSGGAETFQAGTTDPCP